MADNIWNVSGCYIIYVVIFLEVVNYRRCYSPRRCYFATTLHSVASFFTAQDIKSSKTLAIVNKVEFPTNLLAFTKEKLTGKLHFENLGN